MLNRVTSRQALIEAARLASVVLGATPDNPDYVTSADKLARLTLELYEYVSYIDARAAGQIG